MQHTAVYGEEGGALYFDEAGFPSVSQQPDIRLVGATFLFDEPDYVAMIFSIADIAILLRAKLREEALELIDPLPKTVDDIRAIFRDMPQKDEVEAKLAGVTDADVLKLEWLLQQPIPYATILEAMAHRKPS